MHGAGASPVSLPMPHKDLLLTSLPPPMIIFNFIQFAGLKDGASHCAKLLTIMYDNLDSDAHDPDVIIKIDISNAFNVLCRYLTLDVLTGTASHDYASGLKFGDSIETSCDTLLNMFPYFQAMRTCTPTLRYYDWFGHVHTA